MFNYLVLFYFAKSEAVAADEATLPFQSENDEKAKIKGEEMAANFLVKAHCIKRGPGPKVFREI